MFWLELSAFELQSSAIKFLDTGWYDEYRKVKSFAVGQYVLPTPV